MLEREGDFFMGRFQLSGRISRRAMLTGLAGTLVGVGTTAAWRQRAEHSSTSETLEPVQGWLQAHPEGDAEIRQQVLERLAPLMPRDPTARPALVTWLPQLHADDVQPGLKLVHVQEPVPDGMVYSGAPGEGVFSRPGGVVHLLPWAPMFQRRDDPVQVAPETLTRFLDCRTLSVVDEGSETQPLFGNKARKYELLLPGYAAAGVLGLRAMGAFGSNHVLQLALANWLAPVRPDGRALEARLEVSLYPQALGPGLRSRIALVRMLTEHVALVPDESRIALAHAGAAVEETWSDGRVARVPPGGSNPATVLGHVNAVVELALAVQAGRSSLPGPPDVVYVALGSGATTLGILWGLALVGWEARVVGVASQDRGPLARWVAGGSSRMPFVEGAIRRLTRQTEQWAHEVGCPMPAGGLEPLLSRLEVDSQAWQPEYGVLDAEAAGWVSDARAAGIVLDATFTGKAWSGMVRRGRAGGLRGQHVLFWNSFNRFPYDGLLT